MASHIRISVDRVESAAADSSVLWLSAGQKQNRGIDPNARAGRRRPKVKVGVRDMRDHESLL